MSSHVPTNSSGSFCECVDQFFTLERFVPPTIKKSPEGCSLCWKAFCVGMANLTSAPQQAVTLLAVPFGYAVTFISWAALSCGSDSSEKASERAWELGAATINRIAATLYFVASAVLFPLTLLHSFFKWAGDLSDYDANWFLGQMVDATSPTESNTSNESSDPLEIQQQRREETTKKNKTLVKAFLTENSINFQEKDNNLIINYEELKNNQSVFSSSLCYSMNLSNLKVVILVTKNDINDICISERALVERLVSKRRLAISALLIDYSSVSKPDDFNDHYYNILNLFVPNMILNGEKLAIQRNCCEAYVEYMFPNWFTSEFDVYNDQEIAKPLATAQYEHHTPAMNTAKSKPFMKAASVSNNWELTSTDTTYGATTTSKSTKESEDRMLFGTVNIRGINCHYQMAIDGHGGKATAVEIHSRFQQTLRERINNIDPSNDTAIKNAIQETINDMHTIAIALPSDMTGTIHGADISFVLNVNGKLYSTNLGDSATLFIPTDTEEEATLLAPLTKGDLQEERILALATKHMIKASDNPSKTTEYQFMASGIVATGGLPSTHTIGDAGKLTSQTAWITVTNPTGNGVLLSFTDGLTDALSMKEITTIVRNHLKGHPGDLKGALTELQQFKEGRIRQESGDDVTIIISKYTPPRED